MQKLCSLVLRLLRNTGKHGRYQYIEGQRKKRERNGSLVWYESVMNHFDQPLEVECERKGLKFKSLCI
jgi:hypothetical protein